MKVSETTLPGVLLITPRIFRDERGAFYESWNQRGMVEAGLPATWVQDNFSVSRKNVVRGIHYQVIQPQGKLVRVTHGAALDVAVDLRRSSPAFGQHVAVELSGENGKRSGYRQGSGTLFWPFLKESDLPTRRRTTTALAGERTVVWNDAEIGIPWPVDQASAIVAEKDRKGAQLRDAEVFA